ncbi:MAG TPA: Smr/MutS family protein [Saprospiraceae bacterium]|nr:Smr/MutS family protein [Saprospiraceae bacterium]
MKWYPQNLREKLEFDKILHWTVEYCLCIESARRVMEISPSEDIDEIIVNLEEVWEYTESFHRSNPIPMSSFESIREDVALLKKSGYVLDIESIKRILHIAHLNAQLNEYFQSSENQKFSSRIFTFYSSTTSISPLVRKEITRVLDDDGEVRPNASPELLKISKRIEASEREIQSIYVKVISKLKNSGLLADLTESVRNGRRVVTVPTEHKRRVQGVIHDESTTGKTVFIEPDEAIHLNNELYSLHTEKRKEIYRIIRKLCDDLRPHAEEILAIYEVLVQLDIIRAKSQTGLMLQAVKPKIETGTRIQLKEAVNPVLLQKFRKEGKIVVPFDMHLQKGNRILVISGPNAGGKSVCMKSVGLLQWMLQSGFLVTCDENSLFGIFSQIYVDIGDQQSIEDDLSTYSSHLRNMKHFIDNAGKKTLFLIDEFGSGTDPKIGGSIAEAILNHLYKKGAFGVVTTHYSNLKYFAFKTKGIINGSMEFDTKRLIPTYSLIVGKPGSSFAFEIATHTGLPDSIIQYARRKTGSDEKAIDQLLISLQDEQREMHNKLLAIYEKEITLNQLIKNYDHLHRELEFRRKKLKLAEKEQKLFQLSEQNKMIQDTIKELKKSSDLKKAQTLAIEVQSQQNLIKSSVESLKDEVFRSESYDSNPLKKGDYARVRNGTYSGQIQSIEKGIADLQLGYMNVKVPVRELIRTQAPIEVNDRVTIQTHVHKDREGVRTKADVRGYLLTDALKAVEELVDNALMFSVPMLTIVHGKGNGVLRKAIHKKLSEYKEIKDVSHPAEEHGGKGITYVTL